MIKSLCQTSLKEGKPLTIFTGDEAVGMGTYNERVMAALVPKPHLRYMSSNDTPESLIAKGQFDEDDTVYELVKTLTDFYGSQNQGK